MVTPGVHGVVPLPASGVGGGGAPIVAVIALLFLSACTATRPVAETPGMKAPAVGDQDAGPYFYHEEAIGSEAAFGPVSVFLNRGFDVFQFSGISRHLADFPFRRGARDVVQSVARPGEQIRRVGTRRFVATEMLPLNFTTRDARWYPNYTLHLVGGGITWRTLEEWFSARDVRAPGLWSAAIVLTSGFMNEVTENRGLYGTVADHVADLYVFDIAGVLLFSSDRVSRFFSHTLQAADWSSMPSITTSGNLQNTGQYTVFRVPIHGTGLRLFLRMGLGGLVGLSVNTTETDAITVAGGTATREMIALDAERGEIGITSRAAIGLFWDRRNSLLASLVVKPGVKEPVVLNVYPGVLPSMGRSIGLWIVMAPDFQPTVGVTFRRTMGLGFGVGR